MQLASSVPWKVAGATLVSEMARPRSEAARRRLLDAAMEIVATDGVAGVTADAVARRSGVAKTTLYRHFGSTDGLIFAAVADRVTAQEPPDTGTLRGDLESIHRRYLDVASSRRTRELFAWMVAKSIESAENRELFRLARVQPRGPTTVALQRAIARGEIPADIDVGTAMHAIQGPLISQRIVDDSDVSERDLAHMLDMTLRALGAADGHPS
jgi:AcrR family transcriptional regulator